MKLDLKFTENESDFEVKFGNTQVVSIDKDELAKAIGEALEGDY